MLTMRGWLFAVLFAALLGSACGGGQSSTPPATTQAATTGGPSTKEMLDRLAPALQAMQEQQAALVCEKGRAVVDTKGEAREGAIENLGRALQGRDLLGEYVKAAQAVPSPPESSPEERGRNRDAAAYQAKLLRTLVTELEKQHQPVPSWLSGPAGMIPTLETLGTGGDPQKGERAAGGGDESFRKLLTAALAVAVMANPALLPFALALAPLLGLTGEEATTVFTTAATIGRAGSVTPAQVRALMPHCPIGDPGNTLLNGARKMFQGESAEWDRLVEELRTSTSKGLAEAWKKRGWDGATFNNVMAFLQGSDPTPPGGLHREQVLFLCGNLRSDSTLRGQLEKLPQR